VSGALLVALVVSLVQMSAPSAPAGAAVLGNDYPANLASAAKDALIDPWRFFNRECTSFVAFRLNNTNGVAFSDFYGGPQWGNANTWGPAAMSLGIPVNSTPAVGSVAWNAADSGGTGSLGHVAWVANVEPNGTVDVEEYDYNTLGGYDVRVGVPTNEFTGFIHVNDLTGQSGNPIGNLESVKRISGGVEVIGWASDPNAGSNPVSVQMTVDGVPRGGIAAANLPRSDVGPHGFDLKIGVDGSPHQIAVVAYNVGVGTGNATLPGAAAVAAAAGPAPPPPTAGTLTAPVVGIDATPDGGGYWLADAAGGVSPHGDAVSYGLMTGQALNSPIAHIVATPDGRGYWLVAGDGGTFAFGDAGFFGSMGGQHLNAPIVDLAPTRDGNGYWLVASDGGIFAFGDATYHGSMGGARLNKPVVGIAPVADGGGYWMVATDGGIFAFGNATYYGSTGAIALNKPVNGMAPSPDGKGYWFVASDGGIFGFGDALFHGSTGSSPPATPVVGMASNQSNPSPGYWLVDAAGQVFSFNATYYGGG
jgi:surface antigen